MDPASCLLSLYRHAPFLTAHAPVGYFSNLAASSHHYLTDQPGRVCTRPSGSRKHGLADNSRFILCRQIYALLESRSQELPVVQQFLLVKLSPVKNKFLCTPWQLACGDCQQLNINGGLELSLLHVKVRRRVVVEKHPN